METNTEEIVSQEVTETPVDYYTDLFVKGETDRDYGPFIYSVKDILEELYPDNYEIEVSAGYGDIIWHVTIRFPEIQMTNSLGYTHTIYDLFVRMKISSNEGAPHFHKLLGTRTTFTTKEVEKSFIHSHLSSNSSSRQGMIPQFEDFCTGTGEINNIKMMLNSMSLTSYDYNLLRMYFFQLNSYVSWESLEGGPYIKIGNLSKEGTLSEIEIFQGQLMGFYGVFMMKLLNMKIAGDSIDIDWYIEDYKYLIKDNEKFEILLANFASTSYPQHLFLKDEKGNYCGQSSISPFEPKEEFPNIPFVFKGESVPLKIIPHPEVVPLTEQKYLHPKIKNYVKQQLEYKATNNSIRKSLFRH